MGHHHGHSPAPPASRRVRTLLTILLVPFALAAVIGTVLLYPFGDGPDTKAGAGQPVHGVVTGAQAGSCAGDVQVGDQPADQQCLVVLVRMTDGAAPDQEIRAVLPLEPSTPRFAVDDEVVLSYGGGDPRDGQSYQLVDFQRDVPLTLLAGLFAIAVLILGRWQGLKALIALGLSFLVLVFFVLPAIIAGENPLLVAIFGAGVIMFAVLYLTHGLSARTSTAVLGTMVSLAMIGVLGALWAAFAKLTGLDEDTATLVGLLDSPLDTRGLLLAGVVIGALGVLDDVTVTQTSAVWELRAANPALTRLQLYTAALRIGRDHVASAVNTLVMAYAGAALPLLLYSSISGVGIGNILGSQSIAQEIVRTLVGSIGLVAAVPITTLLAAAVATEEPAPESPAREPREKTDRSAERRTEHRTERGAERGTRRTAERGAEQRTRSGTGTRPGRETEHRTGRRTEDRPGRRPQG
ncbi:MAG TPA: YibE/F family protein [Actinophytocola sp.]|nr:YibE/F family protein [Actinophytocola sp.]